MRIAICLLAIVTGAVEGQLRSSRTEADDAMLEAILRSEDARGTDDDSLTAMRRGVRSTNPFVRRIAVRALGRLEQPAVIPLVTPLLDDAEPEVRAEAANAIAQAVFGQAPTPAWAALTAHLDSLADPGDAGFVAEALGRLTSLDDVERAAVEPVLASALGGDEDAQRAAARGAEAYARTYRNVSASLAAALRDRAVDADDALVRRLSVAALIAAGDHTDVHRWLRDADADVRRIALTAMADRADHAALVAALVDPEPRVRLAAVRAYAHTTDRPCGPLVAAADDANAHVALAALDALHAACGAAGRQVALAASAAVEVAPTANWHRAAHGLTALARIAPDTARVVLAAAQSHPTWQVRMYAARAATALQATDALESLAIDRHPNVREAAIRGLASTSGHDADYLYVRALADDDPQLLITAARALEGSPRPEAALFSLWDALERATVMRRETSRDTRRALLARMFAFGVDPARVRHYLRDFDPVVAEDVAAYLAQQGTPGTAAPLPLPRAPIPTPAELDSLDGRRVVIEMASGGRIVIRLWPWEAPTNAARFARLADEGYFDGLTFHRVAPNFVIQGGSPGANEYAGDGRYTRDELGRRSHLRGTVGLSTRGRDTGDAQIFVNLVDNPRLDHNYTIFGVVVEGMEEVDGALEGAEMARVRSEPMAVSR